MANSADEKIKHLFEAHYDDVLAYCTRRIGRTEADDVAADVFATAWRKIDYVDWETARAWLFGIARGVLANRHRSIARKGRLAQRVAMLPGNAADPADIPVIRREEDREVHEAVRKLKPADQEVLRLAGWEELTTTEVAVTLGISVDAAEKRLQRAKARLAKVLTPRIPNSDLTSPAVEEGGSR